MIVVRSLNELRGFANGGDRSTFQYYAYALDAVGWGTTIPKEPYVPNVTPGDWKAILEHEAEWKKKMGYA